MAGVHARVTKSGISTGTSLKTILQVRAASNHRVQCHGYGVSFKGTSSGDAPVLVQLVRQTTNGTFTGSVTPSKENPGDDETIQATAYYTATSEPTEGEVLDEHEVHPQGGSWDVFFPHPGLGIPGGGRVGIAVTAGADVNATAWMKVEE